MIAYFRESVARNNSLMMVPGDLEQNGNETLVDSIDYFLAKTQDNER